MRRHASLPPLAGEAGLRRIFSVHLPPLALPDAAAYVRLTRGSLLDVMQEDYIRTARAKGLRESRVTTVHGLRASPFKAAYVSGAYRTKIARAVAAGPARGLGEESSGLT